MGVIIIDVSSAGCAEALGALFWFVTTGTSSTRLAPKFIVCAFVKAVGLALNLAVVESLPLAALRRRAPGVDISPVFRNEEKIE